MRNNSGLRLSFVQSFWSGQYEATLQRHIIMGLFADIGTSQVGFHLCIFQVLKGLFVFFFFFFFCRKHWYINIFIATVLTKNNGHVGKGTNRPPFYSVIQEQATYSFPVLLVLLVWLQSLNGPQDHAIPSHTKN